MPFAAWLVEAARPPCLVELGAHAGVSFFNFCQAVQRQGLACRCHAVDTWEGDVHAGRYGDDVHADFRRFLQERYADIAEMHHCTFDKAVTRFADGWVDILHIDGLHTYEAVRHDFETWLPKISDRGIVLFHAANERRDDFGVWRCWAEVSARWPAFEFLHSHGLGVLCVGLEAPAAVRDLCASDPVRKETLRARFAVIGGYWYAEARRLAGKRRGAVARQTPRRGHTLAGGGSANPAGGAWVRRALTLFR